MNYNDNGTIKQITVKAGDTLPVGTEVDFDGTTIPAGWEEVTPNMKVLWTNSDTTQDFTAQSITLNDNINNYKYYEVIFKQATSVNRFRTSGKVPASLLTELQDCGPSLKRRLILGINGTTMSFSGGMYYATYGSGTDTANNAIIIPYQVIGYK